VLQVSADNEATPHTAQCEIRGLLDASYSREGWNETMGSKIVTADEAVCRIRSGMTLAIGGVLNQGVPLTLVRALKEGGATDLTIYASDIGYGDGGVAELVRCGKVRRLVCGHEGPSREVDKAGWWRDVEIVPTPLPTLAEMLRCGGVGLGGFLTRTGLEEAVAEGKRVVEFAGCRYVVEPSAHVDVALVYAHVGDTYGNLRYRGAARDVNSVVATCASYVIAEVKELLPAGSRLDPDDVHTRGVHVGALVRAEASIPAPLPNHVRQRHLC